MAAAEIDVKYVAHLARIALTPMRKRKLAAHWAAFSANREAEGA